MSLMRRPDLNEQARRTALAMMLAPVLAACLLFAALDLHALLHEGQGLDAGAGPHGESHPEPAHLDHDSVDLPCPACLFGLKNHGRPSETPGAVASPQARTLLAQAQVVSGVADLSYRLPLSRAPPLS